MTPRRRSRRRRRICRGHWAAPLPGNQATGYALIELLSALATLGTLLLVTGGVFRIAARTAGAVGDRSEALDAVRTATALLDREFRPLTADDFLLAPDSVSLRAFRGIAVPCDSAGNTLRVRWAGVRDPDATKDSVLALTPGAEVAATVSAAVPAPTAGGCAIVTGETILLLTTSSPLPLASVLLIFERGAYSIGGGALRYRRGLGGRQPVTAPSFDDATTRFTRTSHAIALELGAAAPSPTFALPARARVPLANPDSV